MRRVLEIFGEPISYGGQESYVMGVLQHIDKDQLIIDLYTPYFCDNKEYIQIVEQKGGKVYSEGLVFSPGKSRRSIIKPLERFLKANKYDVAHIHSGSISVLAFCSKVASKSGVPIVIVHSHSSGNKDSLKHFLVKEFAAPLFKRYPTQYCACSMEAAKWKYPKSTLGKVKILKNGVDTSVFRYDEELRRRARNKFQISDDTYVIGHVGRFSYEKNQIHLVNVFQKIVSLNSNLDAKLILVGEGNEKYYIKKVVKNLGLEDLVLFPANITSISEYMLIFDVFAFPSIYEGLGIVGVEAQASGLPVVASTGVSKSMKITANVQFVPLNDTEGWINALLKYRGVVRNDSRDEIKQSGFAIEDTSQEVLSLYV